ncbi:MAG: right-handed parallel beta-helix repeat-containing protein, partial [Armatimonadetes bacterium]|nr:right-handed parallel beta-helix repeat-containing protein [Armatimonadota bacterium]
MINLLFSVLLITSGAQTVGAAPNPMPHPGSADFYVSPRGRDDWSGTLAEPGAKDGPFATVKRAQEAVRELLRSQPAPRPVRVILRGGTYYLDRPQEFGPQDSGTEQAPVTYAAARGEKVVLSGGRKFSGGRWGEANGHRAWVVDIPEAKEGKWRCRQLFVNGERRPRTRLPKTGMRRIEALPGFDFQRQGEIFLEGTRQFVYAGNDIQPWRNLHDVEVIGVTRWITNRLPIQEVDVEKRLVTFDRPSLFTLDDTDPPRPSVYWVENVFEALDAPGWWYLDRLQGRLYYLPRPGEDMQSVEMVAPRLTQVVRLTGREGAPVEHIRFEGIAFSHTEWEPPAGWASSLQAAIDVPGAVYLDYAGWCSLRRCAIEHVGGYGVKVNEGCIEIEIAHNRMTDLGAGGVKIGHFFDVEAGERGRRRKASLPKGPHSQRITVADNEIFDSGHLFGGSVGVFVGENPGNKIVHNHIHDLPWMGISVGSLQTFEPSQAIGNVVEYNHVHHIGQGVLSDVGGIYTNSISPGTRIRYNIVHDIRHRDYGGWGIYNDQGSADILVEKNIVYRCSSGPLFVSCTRNITVVNNIFAFGEMYQIFRAGLTPWFQYTFRRNIVCYDRGKALDYCDFTNRNFLFDQNLYWNASGEPVDFSGKIFEEWQAVGQDRRSLVADPLLANPQQGDFRLRPGSPAAKIGFEPWDISDVGPRSS